MNPKNWLFKAVALAEYGENLPLAIRVMAALALVGIGYSVRVWAWPVMAETIPYVTFFPVAIASVFFLGRTAGIVTAAVSLLVCWYFLLPNLNSWQIDPIYGTVALSFFIVAAGVNIFLIEIVKYALREIQQRNEALAKSQEEARLLTREINHRVKNLFAVVKSLVSLSGRNEADAKALITKIGGRIDALAMSHTISQGFLGSTRPTFHEIARIILDPYKENDKITIRGGAFTIEKPQVTPFGLILHELATNAVKYGALSIEDGSLEVSMSRSDNRQDVVVQWNETKVPAEEAGEKPSPDLSGFGSVLISQSVSQLEGTLARTWTARGLNLEITIPIAGTQVTPATDQHAA